MKVDPLLILRENYFHIYIASYSILSDSSQKNRVFNATKASRKIEKERKEKKRKEKKRKEKKRWKNAEHKHRDGIPFRLTPYLSLSTSQQTFHSHIQLTINSLRFHSRSKVF